MKRCLAYFLSVILMVSLSTSTAHSVVTPGSTCSKSGIKQIYKGKTYTCIKSGKKLVWDKGVKVETYDAAFAAAFLAEAQDEADRIVAEAKYKASRISSPPKCTVDNSVALVSIGGDPSTGVIALIYENPGICDLVVRASAEFYCPRGKPGNNTVISRGTIILKSGAKLYVSTNVARYFPLVTLECAVLTGYTSNIINVANDWERRSQLELRSVLGPTATVESSVFSGVFDKVEATKKANQIIKSAKSRADKIIADAKNPTSIAKAWKAAQEAKTAWDAQAVEEAKAAAEAAAECAKSGRNCRIGNTGPGGGIVFYDAYSQQSWGRYLEVAPKGWSVSVSASASGVTTGRVAEWCNVRDSVSSDNQANSNLSDEEIGKGKANTDLMVALCSSGAGVEARAYKGGGKSDWFLPSKYELRELCEFVRRYGRVEFEADWYWSSSEKIDSANMILFTNTIQNTFSCLGHLSGSKNTPRYVLPVRAF